MVAIEDSGRVLSEEDIEAFEVRLGYALPETYRRFLQEHNGGRPAPDVIDIDGLSRGPTDVQEFFGLDCSLETSNLDWNLGTLRDRVDERLLPIGCDSGDNIFCLSLHGPDRGSIIFCHFVESKVSYYKVARSFVEMLKQLRAFR